MSPFDSVSSLYQFNTSTGAPTLVGSTGTNFPIGLASGPDGRIYTIRALPDVRGEISLYDINPSTGAANFLFGLGIRDTIYFEGAMELNSAGTAIYAIEGTNLYRIDIGPKSTSFLGQLKFNSTPISLDVNIDGLSFRGNTLYGLWTESSGALGNVLNDHLVTIDLSTLEVTVVGPLGVDIAYTAGLAFDPGRDVFYAAGMNNPNLYSINPLTGAAKLIGQHNLLDIAGLTFVTVPEPEALVLLIFAAAGAYIRRCRAGLKVECTGLGGTVPMKDGF